MRFLAPTAALLTLLLLAAPARAEDKVYLRTGAVLSGKILRDDVTGVTIQIEGLGKIEVQRSQIDRVEGGPRPVPKPTPPPDVDPPPTEDPVEPRVDPVDIPYGEVQPGQTVLVILKGEHHGSWVDSGRRYLARVPVRSDKRLKLVFDPEAGVKGFAWVPRDRVRRIVRIEGHPDRLLLFLEGIESGSWVEGTTRDGRSFSGQLAGVSESGVLSVWVPGDGTVSTREHELETLRELAATARTGELEMRLRSVEPGEPVRLVIQGGRDVQGRLVSSDRAWFVLETGGGSGEPARQVQLFRGLPILAAHLLPEEHRDAFKQLPPGASLSLVVVREEADSIVRQTLVGTLLDATPDQLTLETRDGPVVALVASVKRVTRPDEAELKAWTASKPQSEVDSAVPVLPGMTKEEAERSLPEEHEGLDFLCDEGKVVRVFCRPPFPGPVFGIRLGTEFAQALADTDLVFDTQIDPKSEEEPRVSTMLSHTLESYVVKLYVAATGEILAAEIAAR